MLLSLVGVLPTTLLTASPTLPRLPLIHFKLNELLLPGESRELHLESATELSALDAAPSLLGSLITTPHNNALTASSLLEVREVRRAENGVGAAVDVVAIGRMAIGHVDQDRFFEGSEITPIFDSQSARLSSDMALVEEYRSLARQHEELMQRLPAEEGREDSSLDSAADLARTELCAYDLDSAADLARTELCAYDLDRAPATSLSRLYDLWDVSTEAAAELQLLSFAAFSSLSATHRSMALGMSSSADRLGLAIRCLRKANQRAAAKLALIDAFARTD